MPDVAYQLFCMFKGFRIKNPPNKIVEELWLYLHFPLHLSLILLLEGVKNVFSQCMPTLHYPHTSVLLQFAVACRIVYKNVVESVSRLQDAFFAVLEEIVSPNQFPDDPPIKKLLRVRSFY